MSKMDEPDFSPSFADKSRPNDRPILFSGPMVRAILAEIERPGTGKTQTRRVLNPQPPTVEAVKARCGAEYGWWRSPACGDWRAVGPVWAVRDIMGCEPSIRVPFAIGDRLWLRETCKYDWADADWRYAADDFSVVSERCCHLDRPTPDRWPRGVVPSIHMPRWASRLTLTVTDVRVQRLQDISKEDVIAEGIAEREGQPMAGVVAGWHEPYATLWDSLNGGKPGRGWADNPWVTALTFTAERQNIGDKHASRP